MTYRLGVDVGGTFTDVLLVDEASGATWRAKTTSTPADQSVGVRNGVEKVCAEAGIALDEVAQVLHGSTRTGSAQPSPARRALRRASVSAIAAATQARGTAGST